MSQRHDALTLLNYHSLLPVHEPAARRCPHWGAGAGQGAGVAGIGFPWLPGVWLHQSPMWGEAQQGWGQQTLQQQHKHCASTPLSVAAPAPSATHITGSCTTHTTTESDWYNTSPQTVTGTTHTTTDSDWYNTHHHRQ